MMRTQSQWAKVDGQWVAVTSDQPQVTRPPALPSRSSSESTLTLQHSLQAPVPRVPPLPAHLQPPVSRVPPLPPQKASAKEQMNGNGNGVQVPPRPARSPGLPPQRPSETSSLHSRKVSDMTMSLSRRDSNESMNSTATAETSFSVLSNGTSITSNSERYRIRAPEYDPSALPKLPPKKTAEQKAAEEKARRYPKSRNSSSTVPRISSISSVSSLPVQPPERPRSTQPALAQPERGNLPAQIEEPVTKRVVPPLPIRNARPQPIPNEEPEPSLPPRPRRDPSPVPELPRRQLPPPPAKRSALALGFGNKEEAPKLPTRNASAPAISDTPPPVPLASRPNLEALQASKPKINDATPALPNSNPECLICRDYSAADAHAARFPRESIPTQDVNWLAQQLAAPFVSATDKARCIFTWMHHNVAYDTKSFFSGNLKHQTPLDTMKSGLAVCAGYAGLYADLALRMGLECKVVNGHGKGLGHAPLAPGAPIPPYDMNHAWNTVKIDGGVWKCLDACWGAGAVGCAAAGCAPNEYKKRFNPSQFTMSNTEFGLKHLPEDPSQQYRNDGRIVSWEEYITTDQNGTAAQVFNGYTTEDGISQSWEAGQSVVLYAGTCLDSLAPDDDPLSHIRAVNFADISTSSTAFKPRECPLVCSQQGKTVRFSFQYLCRHWNPRVNGPKNGHYLYVLASDALQGSQFNHEPFNKGDGIWWLDVPLSDLGKPGQKVTICAVISFDNRDGRGLSLEEYTRRKGRVVMSFGWVAQWTIA